MNDMLSKVKRNIATRAQVVGENLGPGLSNALSSAVEQHLRTNPDPQSPAMPEDKSEGGPQPKPEPEPQPEDKTTHRAEAKYKERSKQTAVSNTPPNEKDIENAVNNLKNILEQYLKN